MAFHPEFIKPPALFFPTLRQQGYDRCHTHDAELNRLPLIGWAGLRKGPHYRCRWCGAFWSPEADRWIGGHIDYPQCYYGVPVNADSPPGCRPASGGT